MNRLLKFFRKIKSGLFILPVIFAFAGCTGTEPALVSKPDDKKNGDYFIHPLVINAEKYEAIMNMPPVGSGDYVRNDTIEDCDEYFKNYCRTRFGVGGYGWISAGKAYKNTSYSPDYPPIKIENDFLLFMLIFGGGGNKVDYLELVWDGKYEHSPDGLIANLVLCFANCDIRKGFGRRLIAFDLVPLQSPDASEIYINFQGYDRLIKYTY